MSPTPTSDPDQLLAADERPSRVLVADDDPDILRMVATLLRRDGYDVVEARSGDEALDLARRAVPDLLVLDVMMPGRDGYAVCRALQAEVPQPPPVIFLTARAQTQDRVAGLDAGAVDYVVKPFSAAELRARVRAALREKTKQDELRAEAAIDGLTGLLNRAQLGPRVSQLVAASRRTGSPLAALMVDLDRFKAVNDTYGHQAGDAVLAEAARRFAAVKRESDVLVRYGGEEFLVLLPDTDSEGAIVVAEKLLEALSSAPVAWRSHDGSEVEISVRASIGAASLADEMYDAALLVAAADDALYRAKAGGRDRVELAGAP